MSIEIKRRTPAERKAYYDGMRATLALIERDSASLPEAVRGTVAITIDCVRLIIDVSEVYVSEVSAETLAWLGGPITD